MKRIAVAIGTRAALLAIYSAVLVMYTILGPLGWCLNRLQRPPAPSRHKKYDLLVIGTFYTRNWCISHLTPLAHAPNVRRVLAIVDGPTQQMDGVEYTYPPTWMVKLTGRAIAKLCCAMKLALAQRPDLVMGYHLLPGALTALLVARTIGARAGYQVTAGPVEIVGGGAATENFFLKNLLTKSKVIEWLVRRVASRFDLIVVRGRTAKSFMKELAPGRHVCIVPGSINLDRFRANGEDRPYDVVSVCRLVPIKQPDHIVQVIKHLVQKRPDVMAVLLGEGPMLATIQQQAKVLGIADNLQLKGHVEDVERVLRQSKVFLLTSRSEGLSIAMAEAMAAGVVPVVANVGDLGDLVYNGLTGWLIEPGDFEQYAQRIEEILADQKSRRKYGEAAVAAVAEHNGVTAVSLRWEDTIERVCGGHKTTEPMEYSVSAPILKLASSRQRYWHALPTTVKNALSPVCQLIPQEWLLGSSYCVNYHFLENTQKWSKEQTVAHQLHRLRHIGQIAYEKSTFYRALFDEAGLYPYELKDIDGIAILPTIDKNTLQRHLAEMCTISPRSPGVDAVSTGGTGGTPLQFYIGADRSAVEYAYLVSSWERVGYRLRTPQAVFRGEIIQKNRQGLRYQYDPILRRHSYSTFHMTDDNMEQYLRHIESIGPCYLHVYPSSVLALARYLERTGRKGPENIQGILAGSETVYDEDRAIVERAFGVRLFSWYGHTEKLVFASECEYSSDYHVWPTYGYFELLDDAGRPVTTPGERGEIVGTGFINTVVPFIRYRTGDYATYVGHGCAKCGRQHPILRDIRGHRTQEMLVAHDGSQISWTSLNMHDDTFVHVRQLQFRQERPGYAELLVVPAPGFQDSDCARIHQSLDRKLDGRLTFDVRLVDEIKLSPQGKTIYVDQRIPTARRQFAEISA